MGILLQILSILIALVAITVSWQIVRNTHRIAFHGESAWRKALFEAIDNPRWTAADLEKIRNRMNLKILAFYEHRCFGTDDSQQPLIHSSHRLKSCATNWITLQNWTKAKSRWICASFLKLTGCCVCSMKAIVKRCHILKHGF